MAAHDVAACGMRPLFPEFRVARGRGMKESRPNSGVGFVPPYSESTCAAAPKASASSAGPSGRLRGIHFHNSYEIEPWATGSRRPTLQALSSGLLTDVNIHHIILTACDGSLTRCDCGPRANNGQPEALKHVVTTPMVRVWRIVDARSARPPPARTNTTAGNGNLGCGAALCGVTKEPATDLAPQALAIWTPNFARLAKRRLIAYSELARQPQCESKAWETCLDAMGGTVELTAKPNGKLRCFARLLFSSKWRTA